jgi:hypothetical protein
MLGRAGADGAAFVSMRALVINESTCAAAVSRASTAPAISVNVGVGLKKLLCSVSEATIWRPFAIFAGMVKPLRLSLTLAMKNSPLGCALLRLELGVDCFELHVNYLDLGRLHVAIRETLFAIWATYACTFRNCRLNRAGTVLNFLDTVLNLLRVKIEVRWMAYRCAAIQTAI